MLMFSPDASRTSEDEGGEVGGMDAAEVEGNTCEKSASAPQTVRVEVDLLLRWFR